MTLRLLLLLLFACLVPPAGSAWATAAPAAEARTPHASVALVAEQATAARGATTWVGLRFRLEPNWHIYWQNPGDSGYPPSIAWELPGGVSAGDIRWPTPERLPVGPLTNFGSTGEVALAVPISVPAASVAGEPLLLARGALVGLRGSAHCRIGDAGAYGQRSPRPRARRPPATVYSSFSLPGLSASTRHLLRHPAAFALRGRAPAAPSERRAGRPPARAACRSNCR